MECAHKTDGLGCRTKSRAYCTAAATSSFLNGRRSQLLGVIINGDQARRSALTDWHVQLLSVISETQLCTQWLAWCSVQTTTTKCASSRRSY